MALDLLASIVRQAPKPVFPTVMAGETATGRITPRNYPAMVQADNSWVYACARVNAQNVAKVELRLFRRLGAGKREPVQEHPWLKLLRTVNPHMNQFDLLELTDLYLELIGNAYWYLAPQRLTNPMSGQRIPGEIWVLMGQFVRIVPGRQQLVDGYLYTPPGTAQPIAFGFEEIVHFKLPSAESLYYGKGCVEGGRFAVDSNELQKRYEIGLFKNMARLEGVLLTDKDMSEEQVRRLRTEWNRLYQGADRAGNIAILQRGMKYEAVAATPKDLDYLRGRIATREEICAVFGVPPSKLGLVEDVNRANAEANDLTYQSETILPRLRRIQEKLNERIMPIYDPTLEVEFDNPVPRDNEYALRKRDSDLDRGVITINEVREDDGKEPVEWGAQPLPSVLSGPPDFGLGGVGAAAGNNHALTKASRESVWARFIHATRPVEKAMRTAMQLYFTQQRRIVEANLDKLKAYPRLQRDLLAAYILFPMAKEQERLAGASRPLIEQAMQAGATFGSAGLGEIDFDVLNPLVLEAVRRRVAFFSKRINEETARALTEQIRQALQEGEDILRIAERITDVYDQATGFRSLRIARTEVISASNRGALAAYEAGGAQSKQWVTAGDEHVRETHQAAEGQIVGLHQKFVVGGALLDHPGDPGGPPEEIINCRCTIIPVLR